MKNASKHGNMLILLAVIVVVAGAALIGYSSQSGHGDTTAETPQVAAGEAAAAEEAAHEGHDHSAPAPSGDAEAAEPAAPKVFDKTALNDSAFDVVIGQSSAPVTMVEYASLSCPHCAKFHQEVVSVLKKELVDKGKLRIVFRHFPLNAPALKAAKAVECAPAGKREALLSAYFSAQDDWAYTLGYEEAIAAIAMEAGVTPTALAACMSDVDLENRILQTRQIGEDKLQIDSTPTMFVGEKRFDGAASAEMISKAVTLATQKSAPATAE